MKEKTEVPLQSKGEIDDISATLLAEDFIAQNGYTDLAPMGDKSKLFHESLEGGSRPDELLKYRYNSLERKAFGVIKRPGAIRGWIVVFRYQKDNPEFRRVITCDT